MQQVRIWRISADRDGLLSGGIGWLVGSGAAVRAARARSLRIRRLGRAAPSVYTSGDTALTTTAARRSGRVGVHVTLPGIAGTLRRCTRASRMRRRVRRLDEAVPYSGWNGPVGEYDLGLDPPTRHRRKRWNPRAIACYFCRSSTRRRFRLVRWRVVGRRRLAQSECLVDLPLCTVHQQTTDAGRLLLRNGYAFGKLTAPIGHRATTPTEEGQRDRQPECPEAVDQRGGPPSPRAG